MSCPIQKSAGYNIFYTHTHVYISMYIYIDMIRCIYRICKLDTLYVSLLSTNNL